MNDSFMAQVGPLTTSEPTADINKCYGTPSYPLQLSPGSHFYQLIRVGVIAHLSDRYLSGICCVFSSAL